MDVAMLVFILLLSLLFKSTIVHNILLSLIASWFLTSHRPSNKGAQRVQDVVTEADLDHLVNLIGGRDGEMEWQSLMEKTTPTMAYKAWRYDPEV